LDAIGTPDFAEGKTLIHYLVRPDGFRRRP
jgi:hypothetical protein